ncbi:hypothetical protein [Kitasatospora cineracea]|uniref:Uncharacterized protein n=1 Tax=Kitasatospora cineracea TaxID=88074 RepID=A0A3N4RHM4_9ACTN|nr:hypothetical protein [Kitasatospora cineracea]RPE26610.1 hypothetical protein EDD38_7671 [Kitasatospora cineracea]
MSRRRTGRSADRVLLVLADLGLLAFTGWSAWRQIHTGSPILPTIAAALAVYLAGFAGARWLIGGRR